MTKQAGWNNASLNHVLLEIVWVWIGFGIGALSAILLPVMLAMAGGTMLYIVSDGMIPETHAIAIRRWPPIR